MIHAVLALLIIHLGVNFVGWSLSGSQPFVTNALSSGITASDTTIPVNSVSGFPSAGWLYLEGEGIVYTASETPCATGAFAGQPACFTGASRGQDESTARSHSTGTRVYDESVGLSNNLSDFEQRTSIDQLGDVTTPWGSGTALVAFLNHAVTWDWPMFEGDFAIFRVFGSAITIAIGLGLFYLLGSLLVNAVSAIGRTVP